MDEQDFVRKKREAWDRLAALVDKASRASGIRGLDRVQIQDLGPLYRRASSDLAYARAHAISPDLIQHLNGIVGRAHALLYSAETSGNGLAVVTRFYLYEFPALIQKRARLFLTAVLLVGLGIAHGYWMVAHNPARIDLYIPDALKSSADAWKAGAVSAPSSAGFSGALMTHNTEVGLVCFASGVLFGIPTVDQLFEAGGMMGGLAEAVVQSHHAAQFWAGILPHGFAEITGICLCGAAGLRMGLALLVPGLYRRGDAFRIAGLEAIQLVLGSLPLTIFAGIIEGMFSHLPLSVNVRISFAVANGVLWYLYLFIPRRTTAIAQAGSPVNGPGANGPQTNGPQTNGPQTNGPQTNELSPNDSVRNSAPQAAVEVMAGGAIS